MVDTELQFRDTVAAISLIYICSSSKIDSNEEQE